MTTINIAGVPEHFNLPWHLCIENNEFKNAGVDLKWTDVPEGTGRLCQMLRNGAADIAIILTEGVIKDITAGNNSKILQEYIASPLIWGVHVAANSPFNTIEDLEGKKAAISRLGSGSHLMAYVNAENQGWDTQNIDFEIVNTLDGAIEALTKEEADYFMWERFTTKPVVDKCIFRRVADCPTPWPCFVIAVNNDFLQNNKAAIGTVLDIINNKTRDFKSITGIDDVLAKRYGQKKEDIKEWLKLTEWSQSKLSRETFDTVQEHLLRLNIIDTKSDFESVTG